MDEFIKGLDPDSRNNYWGDIFEENNMHDLPGVDYVLDKNIEFTLGGSAEFAGGGGAGVSGQGNYNPITGDISFSGSVYATQGVGAGVDIGCSFGDKNANGTEIFGGGGGSVRGGLVGVGGSSDGNRHSGNLNIGVGAGVMGRIGVSGTTGVNK